MIKKTIYMLFNYVTINITNVQSDTKEQIQREEDRSKRSSKSDV